MKRTFWKLLTLTVIAALLGSLVVACTFNPPSGADNTTTTTTTTTTTGQKDIYYQITLEDCENGAISADKTSAKAGDTVTLTATPADGYKLSAIYVNGETLEGNSFEMPEGDVTVSASFEKIVVYYDITVTAPENGTLVADKSQAQVGETVTLTATPATGYKLVAIYVNGEALSGTSFEMPEGNVTVSASFERIVYDVTITQPENGTVASDKTSALSGETVILTVTPATGYKLVAIYVNGEALEGTSFEMPEGNVTVSASFEKLYYNITIAQNENGTVTTNKVTAAYGERIILGATAGTAYRFDYYTLNGERIQGNTFVMPAEDVTVGAQFVEIFPKGENFGYVNGFISTSGVDVSKDKGENPTTRINGAGEQYAYLNGVYGQKFYHEIKVNVEEVVNNEAYPKFGIILQGDNFRVAFYVEMTPSKTASAVGKVYFRNNTYVWSEASLVSVGELHLSGNDYITLAVARDGADFYFFVNGMLAICEKDSAIVNGKDTAIGQFSFNTTINMKEYSVLTGDAANEKIAQAEAEYMRKQGETYGSSGNYNSSVGVDMTNDRGSNPYVSFNGDTAPQWAYLKNTSTNQLYYQASFNTVNVHNGDAYPKFGLFAQIADKSMYFYVDMKPDMTATHVGVVYVRNGAWDWGNSRSIKVENMVFTGDNSLELAVMRDGADFIFLVNGKFALMVPSSELGTTPSAFGAFSFNTELTVKNTVLDTSSAKALEVRKLIPIVGPSANGVGYCLEDYIYDYDAGTITLSHANSNVRSIATLYQNGMPILTNRYVVEGTLRIYNTKTSGGMASKVEIQVGVNTTNFLKFYIYRYGTTNNSLYIEGTNQQGGGNIVLKDIHKNTFPDGTDWTVDYKVIFDCGTVYMILDDEVKYIYETGWKEAGYSFGVLQYADTVWSDYKVTMGDEVADIVAEYKDAYLAYKNADNVTDDTVLTSGTEQKIAQGTNYRAGANLIINNPNSNSSASALIKNENGTLVEYRLSLASNGKWMIERIANGQTEIIVAPENKTYGWMDFEIAMSEGKAIFMLNGRVYDVLEGDFKDTNITVKSSNASVTVHNSYAQQLADNTEAQAYIEAAPKYVFYSSYSSRINSLYKEYITEGNSEKGGVLILGSSTMDFWDTWAEDMSLVDKITGYNVGIGGTTSEDWLTAYDKLVAPFDPSCVMIFVGGNDINVNGARGIDTAHRVQKLIEKIHADFPEASIYYIYSLPTPNSYANGDWSREEFKILVNTLKDYCNSKDYVVGVDVTPVLTKDGNPIRELYREDLIHLTAEGYAIWTEYLLEVIEFPETLGKWYVDSKIDIYESQYVDFNSIVKIDFSKTEHAGKEGLTVTVTDEDGNNVSVSRNGDVFTFVMPLKNVTLTYFVSEKYTNTIISDSGVLIKGVYTSKNIKENTLLQVPEHYASQSLAECYPEALKGNQFIYGYAVSNDGGNSFGDIITDPSKVMLGKGDVLKVYFVLMGSAASGNSNFNVSEFDGLEGTMVLGSDDNTSTNRYWGSIYQHGEIYKHDEFTVSFRMEMSKPSADRNFVAEIQVSCMPAQDVYRGRKVYLRFEKNATTLKRQFTESLITPYNAGWSKTNTPITVSSTDVLTITVDVVIKVTSEGYTITITNVNDASQVYTETYVHTDTKYEWKNVGVSIASVQIGKVVISNLQTEEN